MVCRQKPRATAIQNKSDKHNFTCIQSEDEERFKTQPQQILECNLHY